MNTYQPRGLLDADDFRREIREAEQYRDAHRPKQPMASSAAEERELIELQRQLDEAGAAHDAALRARLNAAQSAERSQAVERARQEEALGFGGMVRHVLDQFGGKVPSHAAAARAVEDATLAFRDAKAEYQRRLRRLNAARARIAYNLQVARAEAERRGAAT